MRQLFSLSEAHPDPKASTSFLELQRELPNIETKVAVERRFFNTAVAELNTAIEQFPAVLIAGLFSFKARGFSEAREAKRAAVEAAPSVKSTPPPPGDAPLT